ncbi:hypothetical protein [Tropicibacter sp. Alg240-R139]|uniref:hypothetical protein n=1 Tax=Tropicibacter sp. Alg240-R139 TaxID=2305991 RepID=UPI0013E0BB83|nr:hypothetical protein [Tropicibacter sp. Alg240-R139]
MIRDNDLADATCAPIPNIAEKKTTEIKYFIVASNAPGGSITSKVIAEHSSWAHRYTARVGLSKPRKTNLQIIQ